MCAICGCSSADEDTHGHTPEHIHKHDHGGLHHHHAPRSIVSIEQNILARNDELAKNNRRRLESLKVFAINLVSSPGAGKTTILERTIRDVGKELAIHVIEGDQATDRDAKRIRDAGARAVQLNTGAGCHLDASMIGRALTDLAPSEGALLAIENVGNLVCPALFDLGERCKVLVASVTEGDDKPIKYPHMFRASDLLLLNKIDLLPYVEFDVGRFIEHARSVNPRVKVFQVSATRGDGLDAFHGWLREQAMGATSA
jgi:hydrogenase nickel incorporation protein HypB